MGGRRDSLERIAAALERMAPAPAAPLDWTCAPAYIWGGRTAQRVEALDALPLDNLRGVDDQKARLKDNLERLAAGAGSHDVLLWGARGMGKSALIRATVASLQSVNPASMALVQITPQALDTAPALFAMLDKQPRTFLIFVDDLGFGVDQHQNMLAVRSLLDGGVMARPDNVRIAVTSNRRGIVSRSANESEALHERDERDDALALADRFGLTLAFHPCDRETYLEIVRAYTDPIGLEINEEEAMAWAIARGNRSGRTAYQFATEMAGRARLALKA